MSETNSRELALLILKRIQNFWGYGNLNGTTWFIGMEEGVGAKEPFPLERFASTSNKTVVDIRDNSAPDHRAWFESNAPTQRTWRPLIFILLYQKLGRIPKLSEIREYQITEFGRTTSDHALLELMPLPSRSVAVDDWLYREIPLIGLNDREEYVRTYKPDRVRELKALIEKHQPKLVLFYSRTYLPDWQLIVPKPLVEVIPKKLHIVKYEGTTYAVTPHPTSRGMKASDWQKIASYLC